MTARQITRKLAAAGIVATDRIAVEAGRDEVEVRVEGRDGRTNLRASVTLRNKAARALGWGDDYHARGTGYGAWVIRPGAAPKDYPGLAAREHY